LVEKKVYNNGMLENSNNKNKTSMHGTGVKAKPFIRSLAYALRGFWIAFRSERNFKIQLAGACLVIALAVYLDLDIQKWGLIIFSMGFVLAAELFNTALEKLGNEVSGGEFRHAIRNVKDISAAAVLISAITAIIIGIFVLLVPLVDRILQLIS
jgi:diacylglycerol kinase